MSIRRSRTSALLVITLVSVVVTWLSPTANADISVNEVYLVPADGVFKLTGRGFGHGYGMSQYGAKGRGEAGHSLETILDFYYPGTGDASIGNPTLKVILTDAGTEGLTSGTHRFQCDYSASTPAQNCGFTAVPQTGLQYRRIAAGSAWVTLPTTVGGNTVQLWGTAPTSDGTGLQLRVRTSAGWLSYGDPDTTGYGFRRGGTTVRLRYVDGSETDYRGMIEVRRTGPSTVARLNVVDMDTYLRGVVPAEMPAAWHYVALRTQVVAARTYAWYQARVESPGGLYDTCDSTACQVYRGTQVENVRTNDAVAATSGAIRTWAGAAALTMFSASNGGFMSDNPCCAYLQAGKDAYDGYAAWNDDLTRVQLEAVRPGVGTLQRLVVTRREGGTGAPFKGRIVEARLEGTAGSATVTGADLRSAGGLKSTLFTIVQPRDPHDRFGAAAYAPGAANLVTRSTTGEPLHRTWRDDALRPVRSLGGRTAYAPAVAFQPPENLDAFVTGGDGAIFVNTHPTVSSGWSGWQSLGGSFVGRPAAATTGGYVDVFAHATNGDLRHRWRRPDGSWSSWRVILARAPIASDAGLSVALDGGGLEHVVFADVDGSLRVLTRTLATDRFVLRDLGGRLKGDPTVASDRSGRVTVALRGTDDSLFMIDLTGATGVGPFRGLGGALTASPVTFTMPDSDRLDVLANGTDGALWRRTRTSGSWSAWTRAG
jgi:stage II sporulation protein D